MIQKKLGTNKGKKALPQSIFQQHKSTHSIKFVSEVSILLILIRWLILHPPAHSSDIFCTETGIVLCSEKNSHTPFQDSNPNAAPL